jgi:vacuolar protein sorting-associated protein 29
MVITGFTHANMVEQFDGKIVLNPGSVTGAYSHFSQDVVPSFLLVAI